MMQNQVRPTAETSRKPFELLVHLSVVNCKHVVGSPISCYLLLLGHYGVHAHVL
jgi:hypothetical protein